MSAHSNIIIGWFRRLGNVLSFARKRKYELPYAHLKEKLSAEEQKRGRQLSKEENPPLPKSSAKRPHLFIVGGKDVEK